jgi:hypothetical protein
LIALISEVKLIEKYCANEKNGMKEEFYSIKWEIMGIRF